MRYDIIVFGGAVVDAFLDTNIKEKKGEICLPVGRKLLVKELWFATGGGGTNTAASFSKLGLKTGLIGRVGRDENAEIILDELKKYKVDWLGNQGPEPTGFSVVINSKEKHRTILVCKKANEFVKFRDIDLKRLKTKWFYFSSMIGETFNTQVKLAHWAAQRKIRVAYNPSHYLTKKGVKYTRHLLKHITVLVLNDEEARDLVGEKDMFTKLHKLGPGIVCVTCGAKGSFISDGRTVYKAFPNNVKIRERTGAGDAFASGFVTGFMKLNDIVKAIKVGTLNSESVIQKAGAKNGLMTWKEVKRGLKGDSVKIEVVNF